MKKSLLILGIFLSMTAVKAQQLQTSSFYDMQGVFHNPATAGIQQKGMVGATYRSQWAGISASPKTATIFGSFQLPQQKLGIGGYIYNDKTGPTSRSGIDLAFAKHIPLRDEGKLSLGVEARAIQFAIDADKLSQYLGPDPAIGAGDNVYKFDAGFGAAYSDKHWLVGASVSQMLQSKLGFYDGTTTPTEDGKLYRHFYFHGAYKWIADRTTVITPNFLMIYLPNAPVELQSGIRVEHNEIFWWGVGMRLHQGVNLSTGFNINKKFTVGYAFDMYKTPLSVYDAGSTSHELLFRYNLLK